MSHYGILHNHRFDDAEDVRGADVYGVNDEKLGKIDDVIFDHTSGEIRYAVVDTGGWLSSKKFLVPINRIQPYGNHDDKFYAELDKERIQMLPEYNEDLLKSETDWSDFEKKYEEHWSTTGDVMHNTQTGRIITPPTEQVVGSGPQPTSSEAKKSLQRDLSPERLATRDSSYDVNATGISSGARGTTLQPKRPSMGSGEELNRQVRANQSSTTSEPTFTQGAVSSDQSLEGARIGDQPGLREPGIYRVDAVPEEEKKSDMNEPLNANYGRRWIGFQQKLREGRDKVVGDCPLCGTQKKVA
jgi:sporulation protein YlmC with PRC-barrel domain